ncbi:MAG: hypothetical protein J7M08_10055, partial [Planctomycetes bacterium]|nr:hypothetical protein [Planctomycetota bacterium]
APDALRSEVIRKAEERAGTLSPAALLNWRPARRWLLLSLVFISALAALGWRHPQSARLWVRRNVLLGEVEWPRRTSLEMLGFTGDTNVIARGADFAVKVRASGVVPSVARLETRAAKSGRSSVLLMERANGDLYATTLEAVSETLSISARAGDGRTGAYRLEVVERPALAGARLTLIPPAYISPGPVELQWDAPDLDVPEGSSLSVQLRATKPLSEAFYRVEGDEKKAMRMAEPRTATCDFPVLRDMVCAFTFADKYGIESENPVTLSLRAVPDQAPRVALEAPGIGEAVVPAARLPLKIDVRDDHGIRSVTLDVEAQSGPEAEPALRSVLWKGNAEAALALEHTLDISRLGLDAGASLIIKATATDNSPGGGNAGSGAPLRLRVLSEGELLRSLLLRQEDLRRDLEQHIDSQGKCLEEVETALDSNPEARAPIRRRQLGLADEMKRIAAAYEFLLRQMLNNRIIEPSAFSAHIADVAAPLREIAAPEGTLLKAASALQSAGGNPTPAMQSALRTMTQVRDGMMLLEGYAAVAAAVNEIGGEQEQILQSTRETLNSTGGR